MFKRDNYNVTKNTCRCSVWTKHLKHKFCIMKCFWETAHLPLPRPKPTLTLASHLGQNVGLGEGLVGRCCVNLAKIHCQNLRNPESVITYSKPCSTKTHRWCKVVFLLQLFTFLSLWLSLYNVLAVLDVCNVGLEDDLWQAGCAPVLCLSLRTFKKKKIEWHHSLYHDYWRKWRLEILVGQWMVQPFCLLEVGFGVCHVGG